MSDLGDNIRRIAGVKELKRKIDELQDLITSNADKAGIGKHISNAYGSGASVGSNTVSSDDRDTDAGSTSAAVATGGATSANGYTANMKSLFDNKPELGGKIDALGGFLDCATGEEAKINLDGKYDPEIIEGISNNGDWTGETSVDPRNSADAQGGGWVSGTQWQAQQIGYTAPFATSAGTAAAAGAAGISGSLGGIPGPFSASVGGEISPGVYSVTLTGSNGQTTTANVQSSGCTAGESLACPVDLSEQVYEWSPDGIHNIAFDGAQFRSSDQENNDDINNKWYNNSSGMSGCDSGGNEVTLTPDNTGGVVIDYTGTDKSVTIGSGGTITGVEGTW